MNSSESEPSDSLALTRRLVYLASERTLSAWIRTALSLMALGFVIDRFGLIVQQLPTSPTVHMAAHYPRAIWAWGGAVLIGLGAFMAIAAGIRHLCFAIAYRRDGSTDVRRGLSVGSLFAIALGLLGIVLIILLLVILP